jgi:hypothetical protein
LAKTGHQDCQYLVVEHHDRKDHHQVQHWHIVTSSVDMNGKWVDDAFIKLRLQHLERELTEPLGLQPKPERGKPTAQSDDWGISAQGTHGQRIDQGEAVAIAPAAHRRSTLNADAGHAAEGREHFCAAPCSEGANRRD